MADFNTWLQSNATPQTQPGLLGQVGNFASGVANGVKNTLTNFGGEIAAGAGQGIQSDIGQSNLSAGNADAQAVQTLSNRLKGAQQSGNTTQASQIKNHLANFQMTGGTDINSAFPNINDTKEQVAGNAINTGLLLLSGGGLQTVGDVALGKIGMVQAIKSGMIQGAAFGLIGGGAGAMSQNGSAGQIGQSALTGGVTGAVTGGVTAGVFHTAGDLVTGHPIFKAGGLEAAQNDLNAAGEQGVQAQNQMNTQAQTFNTGLGQKFVGAASQIEQASPGLKLNLPAEAVDALSEIKATKNFSIPQDVLNSIPDIKQVGEGTALSLTPTETQDLIKQLNRATYSTKANGDLVVNQKLVNLTNAIKDSANEAFGGIKDANGNSIWQGAYQEFAAGKSALDKISDIVDIGKNLTATDIQSKINTIRKLGQSPTGRVALQQAVEEFKKISGIDLTNPTQAIQEISTKEDALAQAQKPGFAKKLISYGFRYVMFRELMKVLNSNSKP